MMAMANPMGRIEPMTEPEAEPMANSTMSAEDQAAMAPLEDLLPTLLQIFLTVRLCKTMLKKSNLKAGWSRLGCGLPSSAWPKRSKRVGNLCRRVLKALYDKKSDKGSNSVRMRHENSGASKVVQK